MSPDLSESSDEKDEHDVGTGAKDNNCDSNSDGNNAGNGGGNRNTGIRGGSAEWLRFLNPSALTEALGAMAKDKASSSTALRKIPKLGKIKNKIARKGKSARKLVKNSPKKAVIKRRVY